MKMNEYTEKGIGAPYVWFIPEELYRGTEIGSVEKLNVLKQPDKYLEFRYGEWKVPVSDWNTLRDDGGIRKVNPEFISNFLR